MKENPTETIPEELLKTLNTKNNIVLFTHTHPDGDALGSLLAFGSILESVGKKVFCFLEEPISHLYDFLPDQRRASTELHEYNRFVADAGDDLAGVALDCGDADRLGKYKREFLELSPFLVVDHHLSHINFGTTRWVDAARSSTGEMVYELALALGARISYNCAYNLYVAICTDTGSFRYECTKPRTMHIAAELLDKGVELIDVGSHLYDNYTEERLRLLQMVLATVSLHESGRIAFTSVTQAMLAESGAKMQDVEGFIDFSRALRSVKVAVLIKESPSGDLAVSLRAKGECDVSEVAKRFDGGGHRNAAGFRCSGKSIEEIHAEVHQILLGVMR